MELRVMRDLFLKYLPFMLICSFVIHLPAAAVSLRAASLEQLCGNSQRIVRAECLKVERRHDAVKDRDYEYSTFKIIEHLSGTNPGETVVIRSIFLGDTFANAMGIPKFAPGQSVVMFLTPPNDDGYPFLVGLGMGCYRIQNGLATQQTMVANPPVMGAHALGVEQYIPSAQVTELQDRIRSIVK